MAQSMISFFFDGAAGTALVGRFTGQAKPLPNFNSGMFAGASNAPGVGISTEQTNLAESDWSGTGWKRDWRWLIRHVAR